MLEFANFLMQTAQPDSKWRFWPFGPDYGGGIWWTVSKFLLIAVILGLIVLVLRVFFGPKGKLREKEWDRDREEGNSRRPKRRE